MRRFIKVIDKYGLTQMLGQGMYGKVYKGINTQTNQDVAVKVIQSDKFVRNPQLEEYTVNQIKVLTELGDTPHIVRYLDMLKTANNYYFVYEYCNGGTLQRQISSYKNTSQKVIPIQKTMIYFGQIMSAFKLLTKNKIMHRDLKPDNILLHNGRIKIADFGFSKSLRSPTDLAQTMLGSPIYMAPQVLNGEPYTMKADIWSLGVVLYEMAFGDCPFKSQQIAKLIQILQVQEVKYPKSVPVAVENLLKRMLVKDASKRIDWVDLFEYKITESGQLVEPSLIRINRTSGVGSNSQTNDLRNNLRSQGIMGTMSGSNTHETEHARRSPMPNDREPRQYTSGIRGQIRLPTTSVRDQQDQLKQLSLNHQKIISAVKLSMEMLKRPPKESIGLAFIINKTVYKQLNIILESLNKDWLSNSHGDRKQQNAVMHFKEIVIDELIELDSSLKVFKEAVQNLEGDVNMIEFKKGKYLKSFYKSYKSYFDNDEQGLIAILQTIDFFQESTIHKKEYYRRSDRYQLVRQLEQRLNSIE